MKRIHFALLLACSLLSEPLLAANNNPTKLTVATRDDDLRSGGVVSFVLQMHDGTEQITPLVSNERLPDNSSRDFTVGPRAPFGWGDVVKAGVRAKPHPGDGGALQPDKWKAYAMLTGVRIDCHKVGYGCFSTQNTSMYFQGENTMWIPVRFELARCRVDTDCAPLADFCSPRNARCATTSRQADHLGCVRYPTAQPACGANETCLVAEKRCAVTGCENPDADGDGVDSIACGGSDCDDNDRRRAPAHSEICDNDGLDEDCDITTIGNRDQDGDGFVDAACWNDGLPKKR